MRCGLVETTALDERVGEPELNAGLEARVSGTLGRVEGLMLERGDGLQVRRRGRVDLTDERLGDALAILEPLGSRSRPAVERLSLIVVVLAAEDVAEDQRRVDLGSGIVLLRPEVELLMEEHPRPFQIASLDCPAT